MREIEPPKPLDGVWQPEPSGKKVVFCIPTITRPYQVCLDSLKTTTDLIEAHGWDSNMVVHAGCPYISAARSLMLRKALDAKADVVVFIDHDLSWTPRSMLKLLETEGEVAAGTYRYKKEPEEYMGRLIPNDQGLPIVREDGCVKALSIPAGFLKITRSGVNRFIAHYPELIYGEKCSPHVDLFNHGAHQGLWWGEDYAFARNWRDRCGEVWIVPDLCIDHWAGDVKYAGNFHRHLLGQPGGSESQ